MSRNEHFDKDCLQTAAEWCHFHVAKLTFRQRLFANGCRMVPLYEAGFSRTSDSLLHFGIVLYAQAQYFVCILGNGSFTILGDTYLAKQTVILRFSQKVRKLLQNGASSCEAMAFPKNSLDALLQMSPPRAFPERSVMNPEMIQDDPR